MMKNSTSKDSPSALIDGRIEELDDWRGKTLAKLRAVIHRADPDIVEEWKWRGVPTWYHNGIVCTGETYKSAVKMTFAKGAALPDPSGLFNSSLEGNVRRAIDFHEGDRIDETALKNLIRAAVSLNDKGAEPKSKAASRTTKMTKPAPKLKKAKAAAPSAPTPAKAKAAAKPKTPRPPEKKSR
jgi:hypothetical protein